MDRLARTGPFTQEVLTAHPYDVAAGKLNALADRTKARDLYDASMISQLPGWDTRFVQDSFIMAQAKQGRDERPPSAPRVAKPARTAGIMIAALLSPGFSAIGRLERMQPSGALRALASARRAFHPIANIYAIIPKAVIRTQTQ